MKKRQIDVIDILKYGAALLLLIYIIVMLVRAGGDAPWEKVSKDVVKAVGDQGIQIGKEQNLKQYYGLNDSDFEDVVLYMPDNFMGADELLLVRVKDESQVEAVMEAAQKRIDTQKESFAGYGVEQTKLLENAVLTNKGKYILLVVSDKADKVYAAFNKNL